MEVYGAGGEESEPAIVLRLSDGTVSSYKLSCFTINTYAGNLREFDHILLSTPSTDGSEINDAAPLETMPITVRYIWAYTSLFQELSYNMTLLGLEENFATEVPAEVRRDYGMCLGSKMGVLLEPEVYNHVANELGAEAYGTLN